MGNTIDEATREVVNLIGYLVATGFIGIVLAGICYSIEVRAGGWANKAKTQDGYYWYRGVKYTSHKLMYLFALVALITLVGSVIVLLVLFLPVVVNNPAPLIQQKP